MWEILRILRLFHKVGFGDYYCLSLFFLLFLTYELKQFVLEFYILLLPPQRTKATKCSILNKNLQNYKQKAVHISSLLVKPSPIFYHSSGNLSATDDT